MASREYTYLLWTLHFILLLEQTNMVLGTFPRLTFVQLRRRQRSLARPSSLPIHLHSDPRRHRPLASRVPAVVNRPRPD